MARGWSPGDDTAVDRGGAHVILRKTMSLNFPPDLTAAQDAIWRDQQLFPGRPIYNTGQVLSIQGELRFDLFERALCATVAESPWLRLARQSSPLHFELPLLDFREQKNAFTQPSSGCKMR